MNFLPGPHQPLFSKWEKLNMFITSVIENHKRDWNPAEARDFIDASFREIEKMRNQSFLLNFVLKKKWDSGFLLLLYQITKNAVS